MSATRDLFVATAEACVVMVDAPEFEARWSTPSVLAEMSVGALGAHLVRAVSTARHYLESDAGEGPEVDAAQYYLAAGVTPDLESDLNRAVRERASADADSASGVRQRAGDHLDWARVDLAGVGERRVQVFGGVHGNQFAQFAAIDPCNNLSHDRHRTHDEADIERRGFTPRQKLRQCESFIRSTDDRFFGENWIARGYGRLKMVKMQVIGGANHHEIEWPVRKQ